MQHSLDGSTTCSFAKHGSGTAAITADQCVLQVSWVLLVAAAMRQRVELKHSS